MVLRKSDVARLLCSRMMLSIKMGENKEPGNLGT